jgi:hypothetical protein
MEPNNNLLNMYFKKDENLIENYFDDKKITNFKIGSSSYPITVFLAKNMTQMKEALMSLDKRLYRLSPELLNLHAEMYLEKIVKEKIEAITAKAINARINRNIRYSA